MGNFDSIMYDTRGKHKYILVRKGQNNLLILELDPQSLDTFKEIFFSGLAAFMGMPKSPILLTTSDPVGEGKHA